MKHTDLIVILDRSGSMAPVAKDMEGGFDQMMRDQAKVKGTCNVTLVQFDDEVETVYSGVPVAKVPKCSLQPRGWTALLDAIGQTLANVDTELAKLPAERRPERVMVLVITDGQENRSTEYRLPQVKHMIEERQARGWAFVYLGANVDAFAEAGAMGIPAFAAAAYDAQPHTARAMYLCASTSLASYRRGEDYNFTDAQRSAMVGTDANLCGCPTNTAGKVQHQPRCWLVNA